MKKCIIWGTGSDYDRLYNNIQFEVLKGAIDIVAAISKREHIFGKYFDHIPLYTKDRIYDLEFDYIIVCSRSFFDDICNDIQEMGIARQKVLDGKLFTLACFDFDRYVGLIENPVTIISDDCWGGEIYHMLSLPFSSPTINISWKKEEYIRFISDLHYYMRQPLRCGREGNFETGEYPIGLIGEGKKQVQMELIHNISYEEAKQQWDRRLKRVNMKNIFIKFGFNKADDFDYCMAAFDSWEYKKICFSPRYVGKKGYINAEYYNRWIKHNQLKNRVESYDINDYARNLKYLCGAIDILKLLHGSETYFRDTNT